MLPVGSMSNASAWWVSKGETLLKLMRFEQIRQLVSKNHNFMKNYRNFYERTLLVSFITSYELRNIPH